MSDLKRFAQSLFLPVAEQVQDTSWQPAVDVYRTPAGWLVKCDLAGVRPEDIRVTAQGCRLTVSGVRRDWAVEEGCSCYRMEIAYSHFERSLQLPGNLEHADIKAEYRDGMLLMRIGKEAR